MRRRIAMLLCLIITTLHLPAIEAQEQMDYRNPQLPIERRVKDLLSRMTLEEKVAQLQSLWVATSSQDFMNARGEFTPSERLQQLLRYGIGEISGPIGMEPDLPNQSGPTKRKSPREQAVFTNQLQRYIIEHNRLGIPAIFHEEALHGLAVPDATSFPQAIALASTWDVDLVREVFTVAAREARSRGIHQVLTPVLDLGREPRWGRIEETYGEDPYLVARMGVAAVRGFQGEGPNIDRQHVIATLKHFAAHGQPEGGTNIAPANYSERILREQFFYPFQAAVTEAGAMSVMASYNEIDGIPSHANRWLLGKILRGEWGFKGFVVSDYFGINELITRHHVAADPAEAARKALTAGVDIELPFVQTYSTLVQQVKSGAIPVELIDRAVARILEAKFRLGLFENPYVDPDEAERISESPEHRALALRAAHEAIILLKNEGGLVPLDRNKIKTLAVIGPNAARVELGGYSSYPAYRISILDGIKRKVGDSIKVLYAEGCKITAGVPQRGGEPNWWNDDVRLSDPAEDARKIAEAVEVAKAADVVLLVVGDNVETSREGWSENHLGDRDSLDLVGRQNDLVKAVVETGKPVIVFLINGRPLTINYIAEHVPAIFEGWYLGQETGTAVADVLFGDYNPAGRLPVTIPRSVGQLPVYYYHKPSAKRGYLFTSKEPLFPFGHGLSYTTFKYGNLRLSKDRIRPDEPVTVSVEVTNTGARAGDEVVQLYIRDQVSSVTRPVKELKDFVRINLKPGETRTVQFTLTPEKLSFLDEEMRRVVEPGKFDIMVGPSSSDEKLLRAVLEVVAK
ncbi:MAG: glycoside hydrolase family 3 C-terminal domain-containing protein [Pyrinomonas methylaliphatogenes]|nr:glycoside hydrolase family 3 C-terminal domain-containing protein [Pyrinomonas methylaliphatogenes]